MQKMSASIPRGAPPEPGRCLLRARIGCARSKWRGRSFFWDHPD